jgi:hypothetical protein
MRLKMWLLATAVLVFLVPKSFAYATYECRTFPGHAYYPGAEYDVSTLKLAGNGVEPDSQANLFDYGVIFEEADDASSPGCQEWAAVALYKKVRSTLALPSYIDTLGRFGNLYIGPYQGWLDGAQTSLVYATALRLGAKGKLTKPLAELIDQINYVQNIDGKCGFSTNRLGDTGVWKNGNSCMDDWAIAASGSAWAAAWKSARNKPYSQIQTAVIEATSAMGSAFDLDESVCIHRTGDPFPAVPPAKGPCIGTVADLNAGTAVALGLHGGDAMGYGFGLLTSIASADVALDYAGFTPGYGSNHKAIAQALFRNATLHSLSDGSAFKSDCYRFENQNGMMVRFTNSNCAGVGYTPGMFALNAFYNLRLGGAPTAHFINFDGSSFCGDLTTCPGGFWIPGRRVIYETFGHDWVISPPPLSADLSDYTVKLKTYDGVHYVSARNGGGSDINAEATAGGYEETFSLVDVNGGLLMSGDEVYLQTMEGQYITADNGGGGDVYAVHFAPIGWERFTIEKTWGTGQIYDGSPVAFKTMNNYYWSAINEGGGELLAPYLGVVTWEVFTIELTHN